MWYEFDNVPMILRNSDILYENGQINNLIFNMCSNYNFNHIDTIKILTKSCGNIIKSYENRLILYSATKKKGYAMMYDNVCYLNDNKVPNIRNYDIVLQDLSKIDFDTLFNWLDNDNNINILDNVLRDLECENSTHREKNLEWLDSVFTLLNAKSNYIKNKRNTERQIRINTINHQIEDLVNERACLEDEME